MDHSKIKEAVRTTYGKIAQGQSEGCCAPSCCTTEATPGPVAGRDQASKKLGYSDTELEAVPSGANLGLGCGNPQAIAALKAGEVVLDLGSGGGFDCFLAARQVGEDGRVIGVDMTPEMIALARKNAGKGGHNNVEFRLGEIEHLPVSDQSVDVIVSNCVVNLAPDKAAVYGEAFRVLKPGGRLAISDVIASRAIPEEIQTDLNLQVGCLAGASTQEELVQVLKVAGFEDIQIQPKPESRQFIKDWAPDSDAADYVVSASIEAVRPRS